MKKLDGQDDNEEQQRRRQVAREGMASDDPQPDTPEDQAELQAIARGEGEQGRALQRDFIAAFHARGVAAAADLKRGGTTYTVDEVLDEMRAMAAARRRESPSKGCAPVKRWLTATDAADLLGVSRPFMSRIIDSGVIQTDVDADHQRRALESHVLAWHQRFRAQQQEAMLELSRCGDDEYS